MSFIFTLFKDIGLALIPRPESSEPPHVFRWRQVVAGLLILLTVSQILFGVYAINQLPGTSGFASAKDMQQVQQLFHDFRETQLVEALNRVRTRQCMAIQARNQEALDSTRRDLDDLKRQYRNLMGYDYTLPSCMELLIDTR